MKQTNNAIKFLVAQYRAIFQNAYVKGFTTALVLTAGMAAGQAQADALGADTADAATDIVAGNGDTLANGKFANSVTIGTGVTVTQAASENFYFLNNITVNGGTLNVSGNLWSGRDQTDAEGSGSFNVKGGEVTVSGQVFAGATNLTGGTITLSGAQAGVHKGAAIFGGRTEEESGQRPDLVVSDTAAIVLQDNSALYANGSFKFNGGKVTFSGASAESYIAAGGRDINLDGTTFEVTGSKSGTFATVAGKAVNLNAGKIDIKASGELNVKTAPNYEFADFTSASTLNVTGGEIANAGKLNVGAAADSSLVVTGGTVKNTTDGEIVVSGSASFAKDTLTNEGTITFQVKQNGTSTMTVDVSNVGGTIAASGASADTDKFVLDVQGTEVLDLDAKGLVKAADGAIGDSLKLTTVSATVKAQNVKFGSGSYAADGLTLEAGKLTAGDGTTGSLEIGAKGKIVLTEGLELVAGSAQALSVSGALTLAGTQGTINAKTISASDGSSITVESGTWNLADASTLTIASGSHVVNSGATLNGKTVDVQDGSLTVDNGGKLTVTTLKAAATAAPAPTVNVSGTVVVNGDSKAAAGKFAGEFAAGSVSVTNGGVLEFGAEASKVIGFGADGKTITATGFAGKDIKTADGAEVKFNLTGDVSLEGADALRKHLFAADTASKGFLNLGSANITGLSDKVSGDAGSTHISWTDAQASAGITTDALKDATVTGIEATSEVKGSYGSLKTKDEATTTVKVTDELTLSNAANGNTAGKFVTNSKGEVGSLSISGGTTTLKNGGEIGTITATADGVTVAIDSSKADTTVGAIAGTAAVEVRGTATTNVTGNVAAKSLTVGEGSTVNVLGKNATVTLEDAEFNGTVAVNTLTATNSLFVQGNTTVNETLTIGTTPSSPATPIEAGVANGATLSAKVINVSGGAQTTVYVGNDEAAEGKIGTGYLSAKRLNLGGATLIVDPAWTDKASIADFDRLGTADEKPGDVILGNTTAGELNGTIVSLQNAIIAIGADRATAEADLANYLKDGKLSKDGVGSIVYVNRALDVATGGKIVVDQNKTTSTYETEMQNAASQYKTAVDAADLYIAKGSALVVSTDAATNSILKAGGQRAAIHFQKDTATITAEDATAKVILVGNGVGVNKTVSLFSDTGTAPANNGVTLTKDLLVESANGLFAYTLQSGSNVDATTIKLQLQASKLDQNFTEVSAPVRETLRQYAAGYREFTIENGQLKNPKGQLHGAAAPSDVTYNDATGKFMQGTKEVTGYVQITDANGQNPKIYKVAENALLDLAVTSAGASADIDTVTRAGAFTGVAHATVAAGSTTAGAIGARFGLGSTPVNVTTASNNVGGALFVAPVYASMDSDGFSAQGTNYGVDVDLYGAAIGADFEVAPDFRVGGVLNFGKGDTEGNGAAVGAKDEFDYFGIGLFAGWSAGPLAIVGDINYTRVSNDLELNLNSLGKYTTSLDSTNLNLGVGAQYAMDFDGLAVVPHAGIRYTRVEADDYSVAGVGAYTGDEVSVVTIPVGVTLAKAFNANDWVIKPLFDLTLAANMGDDSLTGSFKWEGVEDFKTGVESEILDNFSYAATVGIAGQTGNFAGSIGVNYTGSSNTDSFAVSASARYLF